MHTVSDAVTLTPSSGLCTRWPWTSDDDSPSSRPRNSEGGSYEIADTDSRDASETFTAGVRRIWQRPATRGSLAKDLPRLAHRITIRTRRGMWASGNVLSSLLKCNQFFLTGDSMSELRTVQTLHWKSYLASLGLNIILSSSKRKQ